MLHKLVSAYALTDLLELEGKALAIADENQHIIWYNKKFRSYFKKNRIKGKTISILFKVEDPHFLNAGNGKTYYSIPLSSIKQYLVVKILKKSKQIDGYFLQLENPPQNQYGSESDSELLQKNLIFQKELQNILSLLLKENSIEIITEEILLRTVMISKSQLGVAVHFDDNVPRFFYYDPVLILKNTINLERDILANFNFIMKWLTVNKKTLVAVNIPDNIGYNLTQILQCDALTVSPCFSENKLIAVIILCKRGDSFSPFEINIVEQFSALLSFTMSSIKTKELNAALEGRLLQAQKLETIGKLSSGMAHDFSNLLSSIFGSIDLLKKRVAGREDVIRLLDNIENCSIRAKDLTKGLLSFGKPTPKRKELIKPEQLLKEISKVITQTFPRKISLITEIEQGLYNILGNGTEIYQVLLNLCVNAREAIEGNGRIILTGKNLTVDDKNVLQYPLLEKGHYVHISVSDTGAGIKEENLGKIFDPYFSTKGGSGSGLGLYVSYGIIKAHSGLIEVSSQPGKGTMFDVYIPSFEPEKEVPANYDEKIILLADDETMLRDLLAELLESSGYNVIKVISGEEALRVLTEEIKADLLIIDYNMPGINGIECIREIRSLNFTMPVILSSGSISENEKITDDLKINAFLSKPYEFDTMLSVIRKLI